MHLGGRRPFRKPRQSPPDGPPAIGAPLDAEVAAILRAHAAEAHVSEGEIVDRAIRAYDLRSLLAQIRERSDLDEDQALALACEELQAARAERDKAA